MQGGRSGGPKTDGRCKNRGRLAPRGGVARRSPWLRGRALLRVPAAPACLQLPPPPTLPPRARRQANAEKQRLEHKQRAARKAAGGGDPIRPRWCASCGPRGLQPRAAVQGGCSCAEAATWGAAVQLCTASPCQTQPAPAHPPLTHPHPTAPGLSWWTRSRRRSAARGRGTATTTPTATRTATASPEKSWCSGEWVGGGVRQWVGGWRAGTRGSRAHVSRSTASQREWPAGRHCLETAQLAPAA